MASAKEQADQLRKQIQQLQEELKAFEKAEKDEANREQPNPSTGGTSSTYKAK